MRMEFKMKAMIFDIQHFSVHDGPGIRTTVFLKGCPLRCMWCHNPESWTGKPSLALYADKCIQCGRCAAVCPGEAHVFSEAGHSIRREACAVCGRCADICPVKAVAVIGKEMDSRQVLDDVLKDRCFYEESDGGMTISGGEPMAAPEFVKELAAMAKEEGLHVCLETSGYCAREHLAELLPYVDLFLFDIKETDEQRHREYTGVSNRLILENLAFLDARGAASVLRCPIIPGANDRADHYDQIAALANSMRNVRGIDLEGYHPLGLSKQRSLDLESTYTREEFAPADLMEAAAARIREHTGVTVAIK